MGIFVLEMHYVFWDPIIFSQLVMHIDFVTAVIWIDCKQNSVVIKFEGN
jgi:hypothetical protein